MPMNNTPSTSATQYTQNSPGSGKCLRPAAPGEARVLATLRSDRDETGAAPQRGTRRQAGINPSPGSWWRSTLAGKRGRPASS